MGQAETTIGGSRDAFPETAWSTILANPDPASPERRALLNGLLARYWRPVYKYIRLSWGRSVEDAKDLTQGFFCHVLEADLVSRYEPQRGRFRSFLKSVLQNFLGREYRDARTLKRGGGEVVVPLDMSRLEDDALLTDGRGGSPEEAFDRQWALDLMEEALGRLRSEFAADGREIRFRVYQSYELNPAPGTRTTYEAVAAELGLSVVDVKNHLVHVRARLHEILKQCVSTYVATREDVALELSDLFPV